MAPFGFGLQIYVSIFIWQTLLGKKCLETSGPIDNFADSLTIPAFMDLYFSRLDNGIRLVHYPVRARVAYCGLIVGAGSRDERPDEQGLAHFTEHMLFKGTTRRKAYHILSYLEDVGGELNAYTTREETSLYATVLREHYRRAVELISDIAFSSRFPPRETEREREVVIEEINSVADTPSELIFDEFDSLLFRDDPLGRPILGLPHTVREFDSDMVRSFMSENYDTNKMVFCSVGDIKPKEVERLFTRYFGDIPANRTGRGRPQAVRSAPAAISLEKEGLNQAHCITGNVSFSLHDPRRKVMHLLNNLLGGQGMNSRLNMALRERNGYAYHVESNYQPYSDTGLFSLYFGTDTKNLEKSINLVEREMRRLKERRLGPMQLSKARNQLKGYLARSHENFESLMLTIGKSLLVYDKVEPVETLFAGIESITAGEVMEVAGEIFDTAGMLRLIYR